ncbi:MAG: acyl-CoA dehydrogenase family protein, partial [Chloroflexi bacterium]|nr:acyl-CoA dehydrogenase family protein [Chloroflexota bacterium]
VGPLILHFGTEEQKRKHLPGIVRGEISWCQGYSEPEAGSDLASLRTTAIRDGDQFILNGQKLWTSGAHLADWCHLLARTNLASPKKQQGLTYFLLDMKTPGISVRTIEDMCGGHGLCEVFLDNVQIPIQNVLGLLNGGWDVTMAQLNFERGNDVGGTAMMRGFFDLVLKYLKERDMISNPLIQYHIAEIAIDIETARILAYQIVWLATEGLIGSAQASMNKLFCSEANQRCANAMMNLLGSFGPVNGDSTWAVVKGRIAYWYLQSFSTTLARGSSEVQRTILATRGLGLPRS